MKSQVFTWFLLDFHVGASSMKVKGNMVFFGAIT